MTEPDESVPERPAHELVITRYVSDARPSREVDEAIAEIYGLLREATCDDPQLEREHDGGGWLITGRYIRREEDYLWSSTQ
jgi:hypothetical protein